MGDSKKVRAFEAKSHLSRLLQRVERGESITITRHGKPIARLVPTEAEKPRPDVSRAVSEMLVLRDKQGPTLEGSRTRNLIDEGRR